MGKRPNENGSANTMWRTKETNSRVSAVETMKKK